MRTHILKCWPGPFAAILDGSKRFEWRKDDRGYEAGDHLHLIEWEPHIAAGIEGPTGREVTAEVTYVLAGRFGVPDGYVVMSLGDVQRIDAGRPA